MVRGRSGLSVDPPPAAIGESLQAEDIVPDTPDGGDDAFRLTSEGNVGAEPVYRGEAQFEDGGLDDFIRQLKRDTSPSPPPDALPPSDDPTTDLPDEDDLSALFSVPPDVAGQGPWEDDRRIWLAAFAPVIKERPSAEPAVMIRLAAAEEEPGFFCGWLGWVVAWSSMCVDETAAQPKVEGGDQGVGVDLEQKRGESSGERASERSAPSSRETEQQRVERRLSEEDAADAIENAGREALAPVTSSLEKLRDFIESRRSRAATSSATGRAPSVREESRSSPAIAIDRPPTPQSRPKRRENITIVDRGERFDFIRTPLPAFKPAPDLPVILPSKGERRTKTKTIVSSDPPREPLARPNDLVTEPEDQEGAAEETSVAKALEDAKVALALPADAEGDRMPSETLPPSPIEASPSSSNPKIEALTNAPVSRPETSAALSLATPGPEPAARPADEPLALDPVLILFEPEKPGLPEGAAPRLAALLQLARAQTQTIHIIGEASTNHLARRRATDIGAALVQLGATVEILEYDHRVNAGVDQVRLVLMSETSEAQLTTTVPTPIEK